MFDAAMEKKKHLWHEKQKDKNTKMGQFCVLIG